MLWSAVVDVVVMVAVGSKSVVPPSGSSLHLLLRVPPLVRCVGMTEVLTFDYSLRCPLLAALMVGLVTWWWFGRALVRLSGGATHRTL